MTGGHWNGAFFGCFVDTELPTALFPVSQRESGVLGNLSYMTPKDFPGNGDDSLSIQIMERAVLSTLRRSLAVGASMELIWLSQYLAWTKC